MIISLDYLFYVLTNMKEHCVTDDITVSINDNVLSFLEFGVDEPAGASVVGYFE